MSVTRTSPSKVLRSYSSLLITATPPKRQRLGANEREILKGSPFSSSPPNTSPVDDGEISKDRDIGGYTHAQLLQWTLTHDAVAKCFVRDIYSAREDDGVINDFYWIGRVPCRIVHVVGLCVGVEQREDATFYIIDDGTATVECIFKHPKPKSSKPKVFKNKGKARVEVSKPRKVEYHPPPHPLASVGNTIRAIGKIARGRGSRVLRAEEGNLGICHVNEQFIHWKEVTRLRNEWYNVEEPFVIPPVGSKPLTSLVDSSPPKEPSSPTEASSPPRLISSPVRPSSPTKATAQPSAPRLRHPSKLRSRDLTVNTFRIYLKHYMDNAPPYCHSSGHGPRHQDCVTSSQSTLIHRSSPDVSCASYVFVPRSSSNGLSSSRRPELTSSQDPTDPEDDGRTYGFTLGYLRRVPILAFLAQAVVKAERKRRERGLMKSDASRSGTSSKTGEGSSSSAAVLRSSALVLGQLRQSQERAALKTKRLFMRAIRELFGEGTIIISEGPVRNWRDARSENDMNGRHSSQLWSASADVSPNTTAGTSSSPSTALFDTLDDDLSDPEENEEAYIPVIAKTIAPLVEQAMRYYAQREKKFCDPSAKDIVERIRAVDERYKNIGEWTVNEALDYLERDDLVERLERGRWILQSII